MNTKFITNFKSLQVCHKNFTKLFFQFDFESRWKLKGDIFEYSRDKWHELVNCWNSGCLLHITTISFSLRSYQLFSSYWACCKICQYIPGIPQYLKMYTGLFHKTSAARKFEQKVAKFLKTLIDLHQSNFEISKDLHKRLFKSQNYLHQSSKKSC